MLRGCALALVLVAAVAAAIPSYPVLGEPSSVTLLKARLTNSSSSSSPSKSTLLTKVSLQRTLPAARRSPRSRNSQRIKNGVNDFASKYPFVVALLLVNLRTCTGTLIAPKWVLTAAHCNMVTSIQYGDMTVSPKDIQSQSKLLKRIIHQNFLMIYTSDNLHSDIAMILVEEVPIKVFGKLSGVDYKAISGLQVEYAGFGKTGKKSGFNGIMEDFMRPLQLATGVVVSCTAMHDLHTPCMCVAPRCSSHQTVLPGDSGGPLFHDGKVVGVAHSLLEKPGISLFMPISPFLTWIQQIMNKEEQS